MAAGAGRSGSRGGSRRCATVALGAAGLVGRWRVASLVATRPAAGHSPCGDRQRNAAADAGATAQAAIRPACASVVVRCDARAPGWLGRGSAWPSLRDQSVTAPRLTPVHRPGDRAVTGRDKTLFGCCRGVAGAPCPTLPGGGDPSAVRSAFCCASDSVVATPPAMGELLTAGMRSFLASAARRLRLRSAAECFMVDPVVDRGHWAQADRRESVRQRTHRAVDAAQLVASAGPRSGRRTCISRAKLALSAA
jgi:hypothetical protein